MSDIRDRLAAALQTTPMVAATINRMGRPNAVAWQNDADAILAALDADGLVITTKKRAAIADELAEALKAIQRAWLTFDEDFDRFAVAMDSGYDALAKHKEARGE